MPPFQVAIDTVQASGISWEQYRKSVYGFLDENRDDDEMKEEHEERKWPKFFDDLKLMSLKLHYIELAPIFERESQVFPGRHLKLLNQSAVDKFF